jgi:hypothetical protein
VEHLGTLVLGKYLPVKAGVGERGGEVIGNAVGSRRPDRAEGERNR